MKSGSVSYKRLKGRGQNFCRSDAEEVAEFAGQEEEFSACEENAESQ